MCFDFSTCVVACVSLWIMAAVHPDPKRKLVLIATAHLRIVEAILWYDHERNGLETCSWMNWTATSIGIPLAASMHLVAVRIVGRSIPRWGVLIGLVIMAKWWIFWNTCTAIEESVFLTHVTDSEQPFRLVTTQSSFALLYFFVFWVATSAPMSASASWLEWWISSACLGLGFYLVDSFPSVLCTLSLSQHLFHLLFT